MVKKEICKISLSRIKITGEKLGKIDLIRRIKR